MEWSTSHQLQSSRADNLEILNHWGKDLTSLLRLTRPTRARRSPSKLHPWRAFDTHTRSSNTVLWKRPRNFALSSRRRFMGTKSTVSSVYFHLRARKPSY